MTSTAQLGLPLLMAAQAQKHVTVNEALARLDAAAQLRVTSSSVDVPPVTGVDGESYLVPAGASGAWSAVAGRIAVWSNGGWTYLQPRAGWRLWDAEKSAYQTFDGTSWTPDALAISSNGAAMRWRVLEFDHTIVPGARNATLIEIPANAQVYGVTGRVIASVDGPGVAGWRIGVAGSDNRYGSGLGTATGSYLVGLTGTPVSYYSATPLVVVAEGGTFGGGCIRLAIHMLQLEPPRAA
jgi:hypothetical protein